MGYQGILRRCKAQGNEADRLRNAEVKNGQEHSLSHTSSWRLDQMSKQNLKLSNFFGLAFVSTCVFINHVVTILDLVKTTARLFEF
jgi:hypothetical protein